MGPCTKAVVTADDYRVHAGTVDGFVAYTGNLTTAVAHPQFAPVCAEVLRFEGMAQYKKQVARVTGFQFVEIATGGGTCKLNALRVLLFGVSTPTVPTNGVAYNPLNFTNALAVFDVPTANYERWGDKIYVATADLNIPIVTTSTGSPSDIWAVVLFDGVTPTTYDANATGSARLFVKNETFLAT